MKSYTNHLFESIITITSKCLSVIALVLLLSLQIVHAQAPVQFTDKAGNQFTLRDPEQLPRQINAHFLRTHLKADSFLTATQILEGPWTFDIHEIKPDSASGWYDIRLMAWPQNATSFIRGTTYRGYSHYLMRVGRRHRRLRILRLEYGFGEI